MVSNSLLLISKLTRLNDGADYYIYCLLNSLLNRLEVLVFDSDLSFSDISLFRLSRLDFSFFIIKINMVSTFKSKANFKIM